MVLPGQLFAFYDWGGTYDPILPALTDRPVADALHRALRRPARRRPAVDDRRAGQPAARRPRAAAAAARPHGRRRRRAGRRRRPLAQRRRPRLLGGAASWARSGRPARAYGPPRTVPGAAGTLEPAARLPQVRRWSVPTGGHGARPAPRRGDGGRRLGAGDRRPRRLRRAAHRPRAALRRRPRRGARCAPRPRRGASFVISDSNRRRVFVAARLRGNTGWTVPAGEKLSEDSAQLDPFPRRGTDAQTVALVGGGVASVHADFSPGFAQFPERRPFAALDGDPATAWLADRALATDRHHLDVSFTGAARRRPRRPHALQRRPGPRGPRGGQRARVRRARRVEPAASAACAACAR